jgi:hypothetical protein
MNQWMERRPPGLKWMSRSIPAWSCHDVYLSTIVSSRVASWLWYDIIFWISSYHLHPLSGCIIQFPSFSIFLNMFIIFSSFLIFLVAVSHPPVPLPGADRGLRSLQRSVEVTDPSGVLWLGSDRKQMGEAGSPNWMPSDVDVMFILWYPLP